MFRKIRLLLDNDQVQTAIAFGLLTYAVGELQRLAKAKRNQLKALDTAIAERLVRLDEISVDTARAYTAKARAQAGTATLDDVAEVLTETVDVNGYPACEHRPQVRYYALPCVLCDPRAADDQPNG